MTHRDVESLLGDLGRVLRAVDGEDRRAFGSAILEARAVFTTGAGRSGLVARAFAMRLAHLGLRVHVVGDAVTPAAQAGDVLVAVSGSGATESVLHQARRAAAAGARVALVTGAVFAPLTKLATVRILLPPTLPAAHADAATGATGPDVHALLQPMRTLFEQASLLVLDLVVLDLMAARGTTAAEMERRHANLE
jgi:6-phospho-3-hexuloisomerase